MPTFNDSSNILPHLPDGDYVFCVVGFEIGISAGGKTNGSDQYIVELEIEPHGNKLNEYLIDHPSCSWKIDTFLKSSGVTLRKGEAFEFRQDKAAKDGIRWVNPIGLRGWCALKTEAGKKDPTKTYNRVAVFYTEKQKLAPRVIEAAAASSVADEDVPF